MQVIESSIEQNSVVEYVQLCSQNASRWGLLITPPQEPAHTWYASTVLTQLLAGGGIMIAGTDGTHTLWSRQLDLNVRNHGILPCQAWYGAAWNGATVTTSPVWSVIEIILLPVD